VTTSEAGVIAGVLWALALFWAMVLAGFRWLKDVPLQADIWATGPAYEDSERRVIRAQNRLYRAWIKGWPLALAFTVGGLVVILIGG
jgi:hypothetical protein